MDAKIGSKLTTRYPLLDTRYCLLPTEHTEYTEGRRVAAKRHKGRKNRSMSGLFFLRLKRIFAAKSFDDIPSSECIFCVISCFLRPKIADYCPRNTRNDTKKGSILVNHLLGTDSH